LKLKKLSDDNVALGRANKQVLYIANQEAEIKNDLKKNYVDLLKEFIFHLITTKKLGDSQINHLKEILNRVIVQGEYGIDVKGILEEFNKYENLSPRQPDDAMENKEFFFK
jgi:hypothetical protein